MATSTKHGVDDEKYEDVEIDAVAVDVEAGTTTPNKALDKDENGDVASTSSKSSRNDSRHGSHIASSDWKVPMVRLELEQVTYSPVTSSAQHHVQKSKKKKGAKTNAKGDDDKEATGDTSDAVTNTRTTVLNRVSTVVEPYKLTAWMGPSGSGKTSLLSVAADLVKASDVTEGSIRVNGEEGRIPKRLVGVVWQDDLLLSNLTVTENVYYCARLKTSEDHSDQDVMELVNSTLKELGLWHVRNSLVGTPLSTLDKRGISGGERKRVSVACELVLRPSLLLLDEPTSGLDATTAQALVYSLKQLSRRGHSVAVVIHQPRTTIYNMFDHLLLLSKGHVVYDGAPQLARACLESCPDVNRLPPETGIADWMMDIITEDERRRPEGQTMGSLARSWAECSARTAAGGEGDGCRAGRDEPNLELKAAVLERRMSTLDELNSAPKFFVSFRRQLSLLTVRTLKQQRGERLTATATILQFAYLFFTSLFWWRLPNDTDWTFSRLSLLFFMLIAQANGIVIAAVTVFQRERALLGRERAKKMYGVSSFFISKSISDMSTNVFLPLLYGMIVYWTANLRPTAAAYFQFILGFYLCLSTAQSMGLFMSIAIPQTQMSLLLAPPITLFFMILGGFYVPFPNLNPGVAWLSWVSFARYGYSALVINEFQGRTIPCSGDDLSGSGSSNSHGAAGADPAECPLPGDDVLQGLGIAGLTASYWFNIGMILVLQVFFRFGAYFLLRRSKR